MNRVMTLLDQIIELLGQIENITQNQEAVLIYKLQNEEDIDCMEQMVYYKEKIMEELAKTEAAFQADYQLHKEKLAASGIMKQVKAQVAEILRMKERIIKQEQSNLHILTARTAAKTERVEIKPSAHDAATAYRRNQIR